MSLATALPTPAPQEPRRLHLVPEGTEPLPHLVEAGLPLTVQEGLGVPTIDRKVREFANFDHGATAPALVAVQSAVTALQRTYGSVHRGAGYASRLTTSWFEQARAEVAGFVGARADDEVIFTRNTTDALRLLAHCTPRRAEVFAWESAHHAALLPWPARRTTRLPVPNSAAEAVDLLRTALASSSARERLVVITGACNVTGEIWPIRELVAVAKEFDARVVLDAAQLAPHRRIDIADWDVDWVAFSGHKTYAPYGAGALVGRTDWLDAAAPYLPAGGATANVSSRHTQWQTGPARHEGGTPNATGAIALAAACATIAAHREAIERHDHALTEWLRAGLRQIPGVRLVQALGEERPNVGVVTFTVEGIECSLVSQVLADEHAIAVRDGRFCAHILTDTLTGGCAVRASIGLATKAEHVDRLIAGVRRLVEQGPRSAYEQTPQGWVAVGDPRLLDEPRPW